MLSRDSPEAIYLWYTEPQCGHAIDVNYGGRQQSNARIALALTGQDELAAEWMPREMGQVLELSLLVLPGSLHEAWSHQISQLRPRWANSRIELPNLQAANDPGDALRRVACNCCRTGHFAQRDIVGVRAWGG